MVGLVDRRGAEKRHHDRFHREFERDTEKDADDERPRPTLRAHVTNLAPWRARQLRPHQYENRAQRNDDEIAAEDDENRENSERPESAQACGKHSVR